MGIICVFIIVIVTVTTSIVSTILIILLVGLIIRNFLVVRLLFFTRISGGGDELANSSNQSVDVGGTLEQISVIRDLLTRLVTNIVVVSESLKEGLEEMERVLVLSRFLIRSRSRNDHVGSVVTDHDS